MYTCIHPYATNIIIIDLSNIAFFPSLPSIEREPFFLP